LAGYFWWTILKSFVDLLPIFNEDAKCMHFWWTILQGIFDPLRVFNEDAYAHIYNVQTDVHSDL